MDLSHCFFYARPGHSHSDDLGFNGTCEGSIPSYTAAARRHKLKEILKNDAAGSLPVSVCLKGQKAREGLCGKISDEFQYRHHAHGAL